MERNINALLEAANYVRFETLINGNQAAELDNLINSVTVAMDQVEDRKGKTTGRLSAMLMAKAEERLNAATEALYTWLKEFKANRPNVAINIDQEEPATEAWDAMSDNAKKIAIVIDNTCEIYEHYTNPLQKQLAKKVAKGVKLDPGYLAGCSTMKRILCEAVKELKRICYEPLHITTEDRKQAATYFAYHWIKQAAI